MRTILFFLISGALMIGAICWLRSFLCRGRDMWVKGSHRQSLRTVLGRIDNSSVDVEAERDVKSWLYPEN